MSRGLEQVQLICCDTKLGHLSMTRGITRDQSEQDAALAAIFGDTTSASPRPPRVKMRPTNGRGRLWPTRLLVDCPVCGQRWSLTYTTARVILTAMRRQGTRRLDLPCASACKGAESGVSRGGA